MDTCLKCEAASDADTRWEVILETQMCIWESPTSMPEVDIQFGDGIGTYCSEEHAMVAVNEYLLLVGADAQWSDVRPIETCACCHKDFDTTTSWHKVLTLIEESGEPPDLSIGTVEYVARFCQKCVP